MGNQLKTDVCIIGAGAAGLSIAATASQMGAKVVLIEHAKMGGDCLNYGCVPSKTLIACARAAKTIQEAEKYGLQANKSNTDYLKVRDKIRQVISTIAKHDSVERFEKLDVKVIQGTATFHDKRTIEVNNQLIHAHYFVIATGSSPAIPSIPGLDKINYLTNETIFDLEKQPEHLIVIGGGPISCELAQAHRLLGTKVSIIQRSQLLRKNDPELAEVVKQQLLNDGIEIYENLEHKSVEQNEKEIQINIIDTNKKEIQITGSHLLVATGRKVNIDHLNLEKAGVAYDKHGIKVDRKLRTTNKHIFAAGDVATPLQFTHIASYHAGIIIPNMLFHWPTKTNYRAIPSVTYTEPELASVGLTEKEAREKHQTIHILKYDFSENDRAQTEFDTAGFIKVVTKKNGEVLGASIVGHDVDNLINLWTLMINEKRKVKSIAGLIVPYPTRGEISKRAAGSFYVDMLFSNRIKWIVRFFLKWWK